MGSLQPGKRGSPGFPFGFFWYSGVGESFLCNIWLEWTSYYIKVFHLARLSLSWFLGWWKQDSLGAILSVFIGVSEMPATSVTSLGCMGQSKIQVIWERQFLGRLIRSLQVPEKTGDWCSGGGDKGLEFSRRRKGQTFCLFVLHSLVLVT